MRYQRSVVIIVFFSLMFFLYIESAFALLAQWDSATYDIEVPIETGRSPQLWKFMELTNPNDVEVQVFIMPVGALRGNIELGDNPITIPPGGKAQARFMVDVIRPGIYAGKLSALYFAPGESSNTSLSPNIILMVYDKNDPDKMMGDVAFEAKQTSEPSSKSTVQTNSLTSNIKTGVSNIFSKNKSVQKQEVISLSDEDGDVALKDSAVENPVFFSDAVKKVDSVRGGRKANPLIGLVIFALVIIVGYTFFILVSKK